MFDWKKPTVEMLGRWQPWHDGHTELFKKALKKKKPTGKKQDAIDKFFKKKGTTLKTGSAIAAETMAKADRDKKKFRKGLDKIAKAGGVSKLKAGGRALRPVDKEKNPGLAKLPIEVRNKMSIKDNINMIS